MGTGVGVLLVSPEGYKLNCATNFGFKTSKLLVILKLSREIQVMRLVVNNNSYLVVSLVNGNFITRDKSMTAYVQQVIDLLHSFEKCKLAQIPDIENVHADALSKLASS